MRRKTKNIYKGFIFLIVLLLPQLACDFELFALNVERAEQEATQTAMKETSQASSPSETQSSPDPLVLPGSTPMPSDLPQILLNFMAERMMDLPVFRANFSNPISVDNRGISPWPARMQAEREDDLQKLGGLQPGTVRQTTTFEGTYDPASGILTGTLTHQYFVDALGTADYLAATTDYKLTCVLEAQRVDGSDAIEGVCTGQSTEEYKVPGNSDYNRTEDLSVSYDISGTLPTELLKGS
jgi:hypothetical protein